MQTQHSCCSLTHSIVQTVGSLLLPPPPPLLLLLLLLLD
jgi:hypothetical protein